jgi:hypothetical protein
MGQPKLRSLTIFMGQPTSADIQNSPIFHGSADFGWDFRICSEIDIELNFFDLRNSPIFNGSADFG